MWRRPPRPSCKCLLERSRAAVNLVPSVGEQKTKIKGRKLKRDEEEKKKKKKKKRFKQ
jgi:hypothetical protein